MNRPRNSEEAILRSAVANTGIVAFGGADVVESSRPRFSYGVQIDVASSDTGEHEDPNSAEAADWLMEATVDLSQDLDTSKKELDLVKFVLEEMELRPGTDHRPKPPPEGQIELMRACREYSSSRCYILRERLRQVQFWAHARMMGQQVPEKAPDEVSLLVRSVPRANFRVHSYFKLQVQVYDGRFFATSGRIANWCSEKWRLVDMQWRRWLSDQANSHANQVNDNQVSPLENTSDSSDEVAWGVWGPLAHILSADVWWKGL
ncbi:hypothetical protein ONZ43_g3834 [Nemania bipapillata]|uniref:Uncharacterized protein n=1 Tax=Nemania bipapillata TaxID=110536 RepID=A0ACC2IVT4_9PEZI|nr:hypothetical protein ONZ43_g3834 [Nemania bipapillata]